MQSSNRVLQALVLLAFLWLGYANHCYVTVKKDGEDAGQDDHEGHEGHKRRLLVHLPPEETVMNFAAQHDTDHDYEACVMLYIEHLDPCSEWDPQHPARCLESGGHNETDGHEEGGHEDHEEEGHESHAEDGHEEHEEDSHDDHADHGDEAHKEVSLKGFLHIGIEQLNGLTCDGNDGAASTEAFRMKATETVNRFLRDEGIHHLTAHFTHKAIIGNCCTKGDYCNDDLTTQGMTMTISNAASFVPKALLMAVPAALALMLALL